MGVVAATKRGTKTDDGLLGFSLFTHGLDMQFLLDGSRQVTKTFKDAFKA